MTTKKATRGRKPNPSSTSGKIRDLLKQGMKPMDIARKLGCTPPLVYNVKARMESGPVKAAPTKAAAAPKSVASVDGLGGLGDILAAVQNGEKDRIKMRRALEQIQSVIASALG